MRTTRPMISNATITAVRKRKSLHACNRIAPQSTKFLRMRVYVTTMPHDERFRHSLAAVITRMVSV